MTRFLNKALILSFEGWSHHCINVKRMNKSARSIMMHFFKKAMIDSFEGWSRHCEYVRRIKSATRSIMMRFLNKAMVYSFEGWSQHYRHFKFLTKQLQLRAPRLSKNVVRRVFTCFAASVNESANLRRTLRKFVSILLERQLLCSFNAWLDFHQTFRMQQLKSRRLTNTVMRLQKNMLWFLLSGKGSFLGRDF